MRITIHGRSLKIVEKLIDQEREEIEDQLNEYINEERKAFDLDYSLPEGFRGKVLRNVSSIEYGEQVTYSEIAEELDSVPVAVGQAVASNPLPIIIPCHRVVGKNSLGGYLGETESKVKRKLLEMEK